MRRDDPFDDFFRDIERLLDEAMTGRGFDFESAGSGTGTHVEVQELDDELQVVAELSGITKDDIALQCNGEILVIEAVNDRQEYEEYIRLPVSVDPDAAEANFNNGILTVMFPRDDSAASIDID